MEILDLIQKVASAGFKFLNRSKKTNRNGISNIGELVYNTSFTKIKNKKPVKEFDLKSIEVIEEYKLVKKLIDHKFPFIFVTGGAGTGKSTFIQWLNSQYDGTTLLTAPTGIAAINVDGKTLHSLCQLPSAWILKKDIKKLPRKREIANAQLLIIDEISMVDANLLDAVSYFFRINRDIDKPFGGLPVVMVGDLFQLPPITEGKEEMFAKYYGSPKFYNSKCLEDANYYAVELNRTFRQSDSAFINTLSDLREGRNLSHTIAELNSRCIIAKLPPEGAVWLSPRNKEVDNTNARKLNELSGKEYLYEGVIKNKFKKDRLPSPIKLILKENAQVMFTKNDKDKRWVNGSVGIVRELNDEAIVVELSTTGIRVNVERVDWIDYKYVWIDESNEIEREEIGRYIQFPLILGWAITIHKSQGKTIDRVHIDLGSGAFETGQTYVAFSRCRAIENLSLTRPLNQYDVKVDNETKDFYKDLRSTIQKLPPQKMMENLAS